MKIRPDRPTKKFFAKKNLEKKSEHAASAASSTFVSPPDKDTAEAELLRRGGKSLRPADWGLQRERSSGSMRRPVWHGGRPATTLAFAASGESMGPTDCSLQRPLGIRATATSRAWWKAGSSEFDGGQVLPASPDTATPFCLNSRMCIAGD
jgi:hypothetical protein